MTTSLQFTITNSQFTFKGRSAQASIMLHAQHALSLKIVNCKMKIMADRREDA
jgi:hypothetical protein